MPVELRHHHRQRRLRCSPGLVLQVCRTLSRVFRNAWPCICGSAFVTPISHGANPATHDAPLLVIPHSLATAA